MQPSQYPDGVSIKPVRDNSCQQRGLTAYQSGHFAEAVAARHYATLGFTLVQERWRGEGGEIDLIVRKDDLYVFVEVKAAADFARAAERILRRQMDRICRTASEFCGSLPTGQMTEMRFDAALVNQLGQIKVIENAFGEG